MANNTDFVDAFNSFTEMVEEGIHINHSGFTGTVYSVEEYNDVDSGAAKEWSNYLDALGLSSECSIEDCLNDDFPQLEITLNFNIEISTSSASVQDGNAIDELKRILEKVISDLENCDSEEEYLQKSIHDANGNNIGDYNLTIEGE